MLTKLINSKVTAFILGAWVAYCTGLGDYDGAVFLIFVYIVLNFFNKKSASAGTTDTQSKTL